MIWLKQAFATDTYTGQQLKYIITHCTTLNSKENTNQLLLQYNDLEMIMGV